MNKPPKVAATLFSLIFAMIIGAICLLSVADFSFITLLPAIVLLCIYAMLTTFRSILASHTPQSASRFASWAGVIAPAVLGLYLIERFSTLHGVALWMYPLSVLIIGFAFGKTIGLMADHSSDDDCDTPSLAIFILPAILTLIALLILRQSAQKVIPHPVMFNLYFGMMFALFAEKMGKSIMRLVSAGGLLFPGLFAFSLLFFKHYSQIVGVFAIAFFILGFMDGALSVACRKDSGKQLPS